METVEERWNRLHPHVSRNEIYSKFDDAIAKFLEENKLSHTEAVYELMENVINDIGESWYRRSLGK